MPSPTFGRSLLVLAPTRDDSTQYLPGGVVVGAGLQSPYRGNPLVGVIGLGSDPSLSNAPGDVVTKALEKLSSNVPEPLPLDFVLTLDGVFVATAASGTTNYEPILVRTGDPASWAEASIRNSRHGEVGLAQGLGFVLAYLSKTCGRSADVEKYFFNRAIE